MPPSGTRRAGRISDVERPESSPLGPLRAVAMPSPDYHQQLCDFAEPLALKVGKEAFTDLREPPKASRALTFRTSPGQALSKGPSYRNASSSPYTRTVSSGRSHGAKTSSTV